ncbi:conserved hypothetical protein [Histoplasma capsulatum H143]|uniref:Uncharacterized protein n=1 Tax=Ajellomyces capsulatus (strain H143) TaxID=544712 RepID=C6HJ92_AJECH|nr:conserved hypothetical protein [Histoplasma capsulatum H143]
MPPLETSHHSRKRKHPEHPSERQPKKQQLDHSASYWDSLSEIHLTKNAIREHDRRNAALKQLQKLHKPVNRQHRRPITRQFQIKQEARPKPIPPSDFLSDCSPGQLKEIKRLSRLGGPDLSGLKNYPALMSSRTSSSNRKRRAKSPPSSSARDTKITTKTSSTAYSRNFQQKLIDHSIYPDGYEYPDGQIPSTPNNMEEILERLAQPRPSLSPSKFSDGDFRKFKRADAQASKEKPVTTSVIPILEGDISDHKCVGGDYPFGNLAPLTDGTLALARLDHFYGARPEQLDRRIRQDLNRQIIPSTQDDLPMAPNFFLEAKGPDGSLAVATRQACYDGALGARGMDALQSYRQDEPISDNNTYTLTSTYHGGQLKMYATHIGKPDDPNSRPEYFMTQLNGWCMTGNLDTFRQGASAYRNARDWAKEQRDGFIRAANEKHSEAHSPISQHRTTSDLTPILDDSDGSTEPDEYQDAQWSFAAPVEEVLWGNPKTPEIRASESLGTAGDGVSQTTGDKGPRLPN